MGNVNRAALLLPLLATVACASWGGLGGLDALARYDRAIAAYHDGRIEEAEADFRKLVKLAPEQADPPFRLANLLARTGRLEEATDFYRETLRRDPDHVRAWHNLAVTQLQLASQALLQGAQRAASDDPVRAALLLRLDQLGLAPGNDPDITGADGGP